jgi:hypothetical protein
VSKLVLIGLVLTACMAAQEAPKPLPDAPSTHRFLDRQNVTSFAALGGLAVIDSVSTQHILTAHHGRELNPLVRGLVTRGWAGQMAVTVLGYSAVVTGAYAFHKTGHHRLERWSSRLAVLAEMVSVTNNLTLNSHESTISASTARNRH